MRDGAVREDLQRLRTESESYSQLFERAEHNWQLMQTETRTADQLVKNAAF